MALWWLVSGSLPGFGTEKTTPFTLNLPIHKIASLLSALGQWGKRQAARKGEWTQADGAVTGTAAETGPQIDLAFEEKNMFAWSFNYPNLGLLEGTVLFWCCAKKTECNQSTKNGKTSSAGLLYFMSSPLFHRKIYRNPVILICIAKSV